MNVCVVTQQIGQIFSGPGLYALNLVRHLAADGHAVKVIAPDNQRPEAGLPCEFLGVAPTRLFSGSQARWLPLSLRFGRALTHLEKSTDLDLVHFTDAREAFFCQPHAPMVGNINDTYSAEIANLAYFRTHYQDWLTRWLYYQFTHLCEARVLPRFNAVLANSQYTARMVARHYPAAAKYLQVVYKSIEASSFSPTLELRQTLPPHPPRVLCVGGNMQRKGIPDLVRAAPDVLSIFPNCEFWLVGRDPNIPYLKALAQKMGVADHFFFLGWKSQLELATIYAQANVFAMPSLTEALGLTFLEAMAAGLPVIGSSAGGIPEIICDGKNGLLVPPSSPARLADALIRILGDRSLQDLFRTAGLETVSKFSVERMMTETYQVYRMVTSR
jgi:glycosyltransferase involved in cell wall biosynthesis